MRCVCSIKTVLWCSLSVTAAALLLLFPKTCADGAYAGLITSLEILIPSLFPFMVLTLFLTESGLTFQLFRAPAYILSRLSAMPADFCALFLLGMIGGYPCAAKNISLLCRRGQIDAEAAARLLCFCTNAGPAFIISAVGTKMFLNARIGAVLFLSSFLGSLTAMLCSPRLRMPQAQAAPRRSARISTCFVTATKNACNAMMLVCASVILFSVLIALIPKNDSFPLPLRQFLLTLSEVTCGCTALADKISLSNILAASSAIGWGGLCVLFQITALCSDAGISVRPYLFSRLTQALLQPLYTFLLLMVLPVRIRQTFLETGNVNASPGLLSAAPLPALLLLLCCVAFPICLENRKKL